MNKQQPSGEVVISIVCNSELMAKACALAEQLGLKADEPSILDSAADILHFQIGASDIRDFLEMITIALNSATALVEFLKTIRDFMNSLANSDPGRSLLLRHPSTGETVGAVTASTTDEELKQFAEKL